MTSGRISPHSAAVKQSARELRQRGLAYRTIGEMLGVCGTTIKAWLDPEYSRNKYERERERVTASNHYVATSLRPSEAQFLALQAQIPPDTRTEGEKLLGTPTPG